MGNDNVTPIRPPAGPKGPTKKARGERLRRPDKFLRLRESNESDGFTTLDLVNGLNGVCIALDESAGGTHDSDSVHRLSMAAKILSTMVADRVEI